MIRTWLIHLTENPLYRNYSIKIKREFFNLQHDSNDNNSEYHQLDNNELASAIIRENDSDYDLEFNIHKLYTIYDALLIM